MQAANKFRTFWNQMLAAGSKAQTHLYPQRIHRRIKMTILGLSCIEHMCCANAFASALACLAGAPPMVLGASQKEFGEAC